MRRSSLLLLFSLFTIFSGCKEFEHFKKAFGEPSLETPISVRLTKERGVSYYVDYRKLDWSVIGLNLVDHIYLSTHRWEPILELQGFVKQKEFFYANRESQFMKDCVVLSLSYGSSRVQEYYIGNQDAFDTFFKKKYSKRELLEGEERKKVISEFIELMKKATQARSSKEFKEDDWRLIPR